MQGSCRPVCSRQGIIDASLIMKLGTLVPSHDAPAEIDLVSFLQSKTQQHDAIFTEAVQLLESMKSSPSCNRVAASRLVASCQSIGGTTDHTEQSTGKDDKSEKKRPKKLQVKKDT